MPEPIRIEVRTKKPETTFDLHKLLEIAPMQFDELFDIERPRPEEIREIEQCVTHLAGLVAYLDYRSDGATHGEAAKHANAVRRALRKAEGYNITHSIIF